MANCGWVCVCCAHWIIQLRVSVPMHNFILSAFAIAILFFFLPLHIFPFCNAVGYSCGNCWMQISIIALVCPYLFLYSYIYLCVSCVCAVSFSVHIIYLFLSICCVHFQSLYSFRIYEWLNRCGEVTQTTMKIHTHSQNRKSRRFAGHHPCVHLRSHSIVGGPHQKSVFDFMRHKRIERRPLIVWWPRWTRLPIHFSIAFCLIAEHRALRSWK